MSMVHNLTRLLADLWNKIKKDSSAPTLSISEDDIVVFVVGPTGSGKSWFIREATKSESVKSSRGYHPSTTEVQAIRCELTDEAKTDLKKEGVKSIVFVDTPSLCTECHDHDVNARKEIRKWVDRTDYKPRYLGMIYMHRIETDPVLEPIRNHLQEFTTIPLISDGHLPLRLHIVISHDKTSGKTSEFKITKHRSELHTQKGLLTESRWRPSIQEEFFQGEPEVAWRAVEELFRTDHWGGRVGL